jgi:methyl-accepting chemotaxis protein
MRIRTKLLCGFGLLMGLMVAVAVMADWKVRFINTTLTEITDINAVKQRQAINFRGSVHDRAIAFRDLVLLEEQGELQRTLTQIDQLTLMYEEAARELDGIFASSAGHPAAEQTAAASEELTDLVERLQGLVGQFRT